MQTYKKIQDLNLKEVATKTQIELCFLEALVKKDFAYLHRFNVRGFLKILVREYDLDFTEFLEEYEEYLSQNQLGSENKTMNTIKLDAYTPKSSNFLPTFVVIFLVLLVFVLFYYFDDIKALFQDKDNNSSTAVVEIIGQAQSNLKILNEPVITKEIEENNSTQNQQIRTLDDNSSKEFSQNLQNTEENNKSLNLELSKNDEKIENVVQKTLAPKAILKSSIKVWIGVIELKTYKKTSFVKEGEFELDLTKDSLVLTGAAELELTNELGETQKFGAGNSKRFLIKEGKISPITLGEFLKLNKGKEW